MVPFGVVAHRAGWSRRRICQDAVSAALPALAALVAAAQESGPAQSTWGKRRYGLTVTVRVGGPASFGRTARCNTAKIAVPWQLGHIAAIGAFPGVSGRRDPITFAATALAYPVVGVVIGSMWAGSGRAVHDRLARTDVGEPNCRPRLADLHR